MRRHVVHPDLAQRPARRAEGDRPHHVAYTGPRVRQGATAGHQRGAPERRVEHVPRERQVVDAVLGHVDGAMGSELRGVDEELRAVVAHDRRELGQRPDLAGDARRAGDRDEVDRRCGDPQRVLAALHQLRAVGRSRQDGDVVLAPRERVLARGGEDARARGQRRGEDAGRLRRVAHEHDGALARTGELRDGPVRGLIGSGPEPRLVLVAIPRREVLDDGQDAGHGRRARRVVQVDVGPCAAVGAPDLDVGLDHRRPCRQRLHPQPPPDRFPPIGGRKVGGNIVPPCAQR